MTSQGPSDTFPTPRIQNFNPPQKRSRTNVWLFHHFVEQNFEFDHFLREKDDKIQIFHVIFYINESFFFKMGQKKSFLSYFFLSNVMISSILNTKNTPKVKNH